MIFPGVDDSADSAMLKEIAKHQLSDLAQLEKESTGMISLRRLSGKTLSSLAAWFRSAKLHLNEPQDLCNGVL